MGKNTGTSVAAGSSGSLVNRVGDAPAAGATSRPAAFGLRCCPGRTCPNRRKGQINPLIAPKTDARLACHLVAAKARPGDSTQATRRAIAFAS